jgi:hypothetical protein
MTVMRENPVLMLADTNPFFVKKTEVSASDVSMRLCVMSGIFSLSATARSEQSDSFELFKKFDDLIT